MRREILALVVLALVLVIAAVVYVFVNRGFDTTPVQRTEEQNTGVDAPSETAPSPGTIEDAEGNPRLPDQAQ
jgi:hypothetical protein